MTSSTQPLVRCTILAFTMLAFGTAWAQDTDSSGSPRQLIPEILSLSNNAVVPPEIFELHDPRSIGESLVARLENERTYSRWKIHTEPVNYELGRVGEILVNFPENLIPNLAQSERLLNLHQSGRSGGARVPEERARKENKMIGLTLERTYRTGPQNPVNKIRPIYGTLNLPGPEITDIRSNGSGNAYGDVIAVARPEVNHRTTVNPGDTLLSPGTVRTLFAKWRYKAEANNALFSKHEVQIWGGLEASDIREFRVTPFIRPESLEALKKMGLPIFTYRSELLHGRMTVVPDRLLFEGDPERLAEYEEHRREARRSRRTSRDSQSLGSGGRRAGCGVVGALRRLLQQ